MVAMARTLVAWPAARYKTFKLDKPNPSPNANDNQGESPKHNPNIYAHNMATKTVPTSMGMLFRTSFHT